MNTFRIRFKNGRQCELRGFSINGIYRKFGINRQDVETIIPVGYMWG